MDLKVLWNTERFLLEIRELIVFIEKVIICSIKCLHNSQCVDVESGYTQISHIRKIVQGIAFVGY